MSKKDPYLDFLNTDSLLFSTKDPLKFSDPLGSLGTTRGDPLKFSDPLSFGTNDPLSFGLSDNKKRETKKESKDDLGDFDVDSHHSDDEASAPPMHYLGYIQDTS